MPRNAPMQSKAILSFWQIAVEGELHGGPIATRARRAPTNRTHVRWDLNATAR